MSDRAFEETFRIGGSSQMKRQFCDTSLGQVHVVTSGDGLGTPLLLLHRVPRSVDEFAEVMPLLAEERLVVAIDMPGYGCSDRVVSQPTIADYACAMIEVLDRLGIPQVIAVGDRTGGIVAVELAATAPDRIERVVLSGPVYMDKRGRAELAAFFKQWRAEADGSHLLDRWNRIYARLPRADLVQRFIADLFRAGETSEQGHEAATEYRMEDRLPLVRCPALLLYTEGDVFATPQRAEAMRSAFTPCREVTLGPAVMVANERPSEFAEALLSYVRDLP